MDFIVKAYDTVFYERADQRVKDWPLMRTPWTIATIIVVYMLLVKLILPAYMKGRKAYELKTIIKWYNVMQIVSCTVATWGIATSGWTTHYSFGCQVPDYSNDPESMRMLRFLWWTVVLKLAELVETAFFILRKRERQASFLHIYHHVSTLVVIWSGVKYVGGGMTSFPPMLNNAVHIIMYSYYLAAAEGGAATRAFLNKYKKWITVMQMAQFTILLLHSAQVMLPSCKAPSGIMYLYYPNVMFVYYLFYRFFKDNYQKNQAKKKTEQNSNGHKKA